MFSTPKAMKLIRNDKVRLADQKNKNCKHLGLDEKDR